MGAGAIVAIAERFDAVEMSKGLVVTGGVGAMFGDGLVDVFELL